MPSPLRPGGQLLSPAAAAAAAAAAARALNTAFDSVRSAAAVESTAHTVRVLLAAWAVKCAGGACHLLPLLWALFVGAFSAPLWAHLQARLSEIVRDCPRLSESHRRHVHWTRPLDARTTGHIHWTCKLDASTGRVDDRTYPLDMSTGHVHCPDTSAGDTLRLTRSLARSPVRPPAPPPDSRAATPPLPGDARPAASRLPRGAAAGSRARGCGGGTHCDGGQPARPLFWRGDAALGGGGGVAVARRSSRGGGEGCEAE